MSASAEYDDLPPRHYPRSTPEASLPISASTPSIASSASSSKAASPAPTLFLSEVDDNNVTRSSRQQPGRPVPPADVVVERVDHGSRGGGDAGAGTTMTLEGGNNNTIAANIRVLINEGMDAEAAESALRISKNDLQMAREILRVFVPKNHHSQHQQSQQQQQQQSNPASLSQQQINAQRAQEHYRN